MTFLAARSTFPHMFYFLSGLTFGLGAGLTPGPLLALVISETLRGGFSRGTMIALAPLITDAPIIVAATFLLSLLPPWGLAVIALAGGLFVCYQGIEAVRTSGQVAGLPSERPPTAGQSLRRGVITNALNPHPYLFWAAVGGPALLTAGRDSFGLAALFLVGFYLPLVGSKLGLAAVVSQHHRLLGGRGYPRALILVGLALFALGAMIALSAVQELLAK